MSTLNALISQLDTRLRREPPTTLRVSLTSDGQTYLVFDLYGFLCATGSMNAVTALLRLEASGHGARRTLFPESLAPHDEEEYSSPIVVRTPTEDEVARMRFTPTESPDPADFVAQHTNLQPEVAPPAGAQAAARRAMEAYRNREAPRAPTEDVEDTVIPVATQGI